VHHEPVQVLQRPSSRAPPRTGHTGDDDHLGRQLPAQFDRHPFPPPSVLCCAAVSPRPSERSPVRCACTASANFGPIPGTAAISSTVAEDSRFTEPNSLISAALRAGPSPGSSSRLLPVRALALFCRW